MFQDSEGESNKFESPLKCNQKSKLLKVDQISECKQEEEELEETQFGDENEEEEKRKETKKKNSIIEKMYQGFLK